MTTAPAATAVDRPVERVGQLDTLHLQGPVVAGSRHESRHAGVVAGHDTEADGVEEILEQQALRVQAEHLGDDERAAQLDRIEPRHRSLHLPGADPPRPPDAQCVGRLAVAVEGEGVVERAAGAHRPVAGSRPRPHGEHEGRPAHEVWRGQGGDPPFAQALAHDADVEVLEIADAAMEVLGGRRAGP